MTDSPTKDDDCYIHGPGTFPQSDGCKCEKCMPTSKQKLLCPFCGGRDIRAHHRGHPTAGEWVIECHSCSCELTGFASEQDAWKTWNGRWKPTPVETTDEQREQVHHLEQRVRDLTEELNRLKLANAICSPANTLDNLMQALHAKQAKIDVLMAEFCPGEMAAETALDSSVQQALDFIGWKCDGESHKDVVGNLDISDAASVLRWAILRSQAQLRMVGHQRDEYAALLREASTNLRVPDLVTRIERSVDCSPLEPSPSRIPHDIGLRGPDDEGVTAPGEELLPEKPQT